jgi:hypothetical protein
MPIFVLIMYLLAVLCFLAAALVHPDQRDRTRISIGWLGLAFFATPALVAAIDAVL